MFYHILYVTILLLFKEELFRIPENFDKLKERALEKSYREPSD